MRKLLALLLLLALPACVSRKTSPETRLNKADEAVLDQYLKEWREGKQP